MIRKLQPADIPQVSKIWLSANLAAHPFIDASYWQSHMKMVKENLVLADVSVYITEDQQQIVGFIGLEENYIAGIFVSAAYQSQGIGKQLLDDVKKSKKQLTLHVYQKNRQAIQFYLREGFQIQKEGMDLDTGEKEYTMVWNLAETPQYLPRTNADQTL